MSYLAEPLENSEIVTVGSPGFELEGITRT